MLLIFAYDRLDKGYKERQMRITIKTAKARAQKVWDFALNNKEYLILGLGLLLAPTTAWWLIISPINNILSFAQLSLCIAQLLVSTNAQTANTLFGLHAKPEDYQDNLYYLIIMQFACLLPLLAINRIATILNLVITLNHMPRLISTSLSQTVSGKHVLDKQRFTQAALETNLLSGLPDITT